MTLGGAFIVYDTYMGKLFFRLFYSYACSHIKIILFLITGFIVFICSPHIFIIHEVLNESDFQMSYDLIVAQP